MFDSLSWGAILVALVQAAVAAPFLVAAMRLRSWLDSRGERRRVDASKARFDEFHRRERAFEATVARSLGKD